MSLDEVRFHTSLRDLLLAFSRDAASTPSLPQALENVTESIAELLGLSRIDVWLYDRRARELALATRGSDPNGASVLSMAPDAGETHVAARALRLERPEFDGGRILAPLRGWRRALGSLILHPPPAIGRPELDQLLDFSHEISRQLSIAIENVQLLDDVLQQRRLLEDTFNSLADLVVVIDSRMRIVQTNDAFAARIGVSRDDVMQRSIQEFVSPATLESVEGGASHPVQDDRLGGIFLWTATPLVSADHAQASGRVLVGRDITRQTRLEADRAALRERLAQSEKLASLGQFVAGIAHEMNNPLQGVQGHLELLLMTDAARPVRKEQRQIYQDADRAASRQRHGIETVIERSGELVPPVLGDALLLQQALLNILINAEHAILEHQTSARRITISTQAAADRVRVCIRDTGAGISADVLPRIFDPFFTTKEVGRGTGLGLAITYGIVQEHGGTIAAANVPGGGAEFCIELPAAPSVVK